MGNHDEEKPEQVQGKGALPAAAYPRKCMMFAKKHEDGHVPVSEGISQKTLVYGKHTLMTEFVLKAGSVLPAHRHPQEQTGYLLAGHLILTIGDDIFDVHPGDSWAIFGGVEHRAKVLADAVAIEVFSPVRKEFLPE